MENTRQTWVVETNTAGQTVVNGVVLWDSEPDIAPSVADQLFGTPTGRHTHPDTHPAWMTFTDGACRVCAAHYQPAAERLGQS